MSKVKIVFDTNSAFALQNDNLEFLRKIVSKYFIKLKENLGKYKIDEKSDIAITEVTKKEGLQKLKKNTLDNFNKLQRLDKIFGDTFPEIAVSIQLETENLKTKIEKLVENGLSQNKIGIIPISKIYSHEEILDRAIENIPPFKTVEESKDKGYKDTLAWVSIIEYANNENEYGTYILFTTDGDFLKNTEELQKEFKQKTGKNIFIGDPENSILILDNVFDLKLKTNEILDEVRQKINDDLKIQDMFTLSSLKSLHQGHSFIPRERWYTEVSQILIEDILDINIEDLRENTIILEVTLVLNPIYISSGAQTGKKIHSPLPILDNFVPMGSFDFQPNFLDEQPKKIYQRFKVEYSKKEKSIKILQTEIPKSGFSIW